MPNKTLTTGTKGTIAIPDRTSRFGFRNVSGATIWYRQGDVSLTGDTNATTGGIELRDGEERWFAASHGVALPNMFSFIQGSGSDKALSYDVF